MRTRERARVDHRRAQEKSQRHLTAPTPPTRVKRSQKKTTKEQPERLFLETRPSGVKKRRAPAMHDRVRSRTAFFFKSKSMGTAEQQQQSSNTREPHFILDGGRCKASVAYTARQLHFSHRVVVVCCCLVMHGDAMHLLVRVVPCRCRF